MKDNAFEIFDTTLRDGAQSPDISFSVEDKLLIIEALGKIGVTFAEVGSPGISEKDAELFERLYDLKKNDKLPIKIVAFMPTIKCGMKAEENEAFVKGVNNPFRTVSICGKASRSQAERILGADEAENQRIIFDSIKYAKEKGCFVIFDAEHFFDGMEEDFDFATGAVDAAVSAGADRIILCDTNGGSLPRVIEKGVKCITERFSVPVGIHCHNDSGLAVANSIVAVESGAIHIQGTVGGIGERCGNADLSVLIPDIQLKLNMKIVSPRQLSSLSSVSRFISDVSNIVFNERTPYIGRYAFSHKAGLHIDGNIKMGGFEHISPCLVGNKTRTLLTEQAGKAAAKEKLLSFIGKNIKIEMDDKHLYQYADEILSRVKKNESEGYAFDYADGSLSLEVLDVLKLRKKYFEILDFKIVLSDPSKGETLTSSLIKIQVEGDSVLVAAEGNGPVDSMNNALRMALEKFYPSLSEMRLIDYKVRVINSAKATKAKVRVVIDSADGKSSWRTVGVSPDIIQASWIALRDSIDYKLSISDGLITQNN